MAKSIRAPWICATCGRGFANRAGMAIHQKATGHKGRRIE